MIAVDTSTWIGFLERDGGEDADLLDRALQDRLVLMVPVVLTEVLKAVSIVEFLCLRETRISVRSPKPQASISLSPPAEPAPDSPSNHVRAALL